MEAEPDCKAMYVAFEAKVNAGTATIEECTAVTELLYDRLKETFTKYYEVINSNRDRIGKPDAELDKIVHENEDIIFLIPMMFTLRQKIGNPGLKCYRSMAPPCNHSPIRPLHKMGERSFPDA